MMKSVDVDVEIHKVIEAERRSFDESENNILRRLLLGDSRKSTHEKPEKPTLIGAPLSVGKRRTGNWSVEIFSKRIDAKNLKEAYATFVFELSQSQSNLLETLANISLGSRQIVANTPKGLYPKSPHLAEPSRNNFCKIGDWYLDLNLSEAQAASRLRRIASEAGVNYGSEAAVKRDLKMI